MFVLVLNKVLTTFSPDIDTILLLSLSDSSRFPCGDMVISLKAKSVSIVSFTARRLFINCSFLSSVCAHARLDPAYTIDGHQRRASRSVRTDDFGISCLRVSVCFESSLEDFLETEGETICLIGSAAACVDSAVDSGADSFLPDSVAEDSSVPRYKSWNAPLSLAVSVTVLSTPGSDEFCDFLWVLIDGLAWPSSQWTVCWTVILPNIVDNDSSSIWVGVEVWHASRERLPFRTPGSVPHFGTC